MSESMPPWVSRAAALALLVAALLGIYAVSVGPLVAAYWRVGEATQDAEALLERYRRVAAQRQDLEAQVRGLTARQAESGIYLPGDTDALAAAELQEIVNSTVTSGGGHLRSVQILPAKADGEFRRVGVRAQLTGNIAAIARILYAFEAGDTFLFVDNLDISNRRARRTRDARDPSADDDPELLIRLDLSGYVQPEADS